MAKERTYTIDKFLGVNQSPDGDTGLRLGEASEMLNFRITAEGNLQLRPGYKAVTTLADGHPVRGMWNGYVNGSEVWLVACNGNVYSINISTYAATSLGTLTDATTTFFPFSDNVYILNGTEYKYWNGTTFGTVSGYAPIVIIAAAPATGTGTTNEQVNKLTGSRWVWFSSTGSATVYQLPETGLSSIDQVLQDDSDVTSSVTLNSSAGTVTFSTAPDSGTNDIKVKYTVSSTDRATIVAQKYAEFYNGSTDNRIFLYGDGTNKAYYSGIEYESGNPTAEYFPDLNVLDVGTENTPISSMIRQYNKMLTFKKGDGTFITYYDTLTLADGTVTAGFYTHAVEKDIGNEALGQVKLVNNFAMSLQGNSVYRWGLVYTSGVQDERNSKRISDRVRETLGGLDLSSAITFDDEWNREFWVVQNGTACIYQYSNEAKGDSSYKNNVWYVYDNIPATCFVSVDGELYFGSDDGYIMHVSRTYHNDNGTEITATWKTGSMAFDESQLRKYIRLIFVSMKPESGSRITLTAESDNKSDYDEKLISLGLSTFLRADFAHFSFGTNRKPKTKKVKFKIKKFTHGKLIFSSYSTTATATITSMEIPVEYGTYAK